MIHHLLIFIVAWILGIASVVSLSHIDIDEKEDFDDDWDIK